MAVSRLTQIGIGGAPYPAFAPKDSAPSSGPHDPGVISRLTQIGIGGKAYLAFDPKGEAPVVTPPTGQVDTSLSGGYLGHVAPYRRRTPAQLRKDRERFGLIEAAAEIVNDVALRQAEQPGLDAAQQLAELQGELGARGISLSSEYISLLERLRARYEADASEERDIVFVMAVIAEMDDD